MLLDNLGNIYSLEESRSSSWKVIMVATTITANNNTNTDVLSSSSVPRSPHPVTQEVGDR